MPAVGENQLHSGMKVWRSPMRRDVAIVDGAEGLLQHEFGVETVGEAESRRRP